MFRINEVLKYEENLFRVLLLLPEQLVWIDVADPKAFPVVMLTRELRSALEEGLLIRVEAIVDDQVERLFRIAIDKHLLKDKGISVPYAHRRFAELYNNYFPEVPESKIPTKWQMLHFYKREYSQVEKLIKRTNAIEYTKDVRPLKGTANSNVLGPGSRFEIDATIADIYLGSDSDRGNIVGRPVIYMVIDVFSRMVAGFYVGFESPSYAAAMQGLVSMSQRYEVFQLKNISRSSSVITAMPKSIHVRSMQSS
ncbi:hypothetical protein [Desulfovibrio sp. JC022]|uniref:hypothetical protein n=1 Tax=Desulfovibrio sp. JC022 TaxID=2593642 RepID=UPI0013D16940|nr:hypothetical protein [Desulfovibrio sp. JC022]NDV22253.1 hypothetical protein [Desulfovibrio sp. JC022]